MQKILFVEHCKDLKAGGAQRVFLNLVKNFPTSKYNVAVAYKTPGVGDLSAELSGNIKQYKYDSKEPDGAAGGASSYFKFLLGIPYNFFLWMRIFWLWKPDLVYVHSLISALHFGLLKPFFGYKLVYHEHNMANQRPNNIVWRTLFSTMNFFADAVIAISRAVKKSLVDFQIPVSKITVIHNGVEPITSNAAQARAAGLSRLGDNGSECIYVGMVGHFREWKGQLLFAEMANHIISSGSFKNIKFLIVGGVHDSAYFQKVEKYIADNKLSGAVSLLGHQERPFELIAAMDIVVVPSTPEPFGLVVLEAMQYSKPVVAFNIGGPAEIIVDRKTGLLVNNVSSKDLSDAVKSLINNQQVRGEYGNNGLDEVQKNYSIDRQVNNVLTLINEVMS